MATPRSQRGPAAEGVAHGITTTPIHQVPNLQQRRWQMLLKSTAHSQRFGIKRTLRNQGVQTLPWRAQKLFCHKFGHPFGLFRACFFSEASVVTNCGKDDPPVNKLRGSERYVDTTRHGYPNVQRYIDTRSP